METNGSGGRFPWRISWLNQVQGPAHWQEIDRDEVDQAFDPAALLDLHSITLLEDTHDPLGKKDAALVETDGLAELAHIAEEVARLIQPVHPSPLFRAQLKAALLTAHPQNRTQRRWPAAAFGVPGATVCTRRGHRS